MDNQLAIERSHAAAQSIEDRDRISWPPTMWPVDITILRSLPTELMPDEHHLQKLKYPWELLELIMETLEGNIKGVRIAEDVSLPDNVDLNGDVWIDQGVRIYPFTEIVGPVYIGKDCIVGNFSQLRECVIGQGSLVGERTSIARSFVGRNSAFHINYVGDSLISEEVSMGGGCKTANLRLDNSTVRSSVSDLMFDTNLPKLGAMIGGSTKFGADCLIMPGVKIGSNCFIGPQVVVQKDVPDGQFIKLVQNLQVKENRIT